MSNKNPLIPAEAGTQCFGLIRIAKRLSPFQSQSRACGSHWVPASAGKSGKV